MAAAELSRLASSRVLVTGASGFIGSHLVRRLAAMEVDVIGLSRSPGRLHEPPQGGRFIACDLASAEQTRSAVQEIQPDIVFHLAAHPDGRESGEQTYAVLQHNLAGLANLLEALRELPSVALVYGDSAKVYGNSGVPYRSYQPVEPLSTYAVSKAAGWGLIDVYRRVHGIEAVGLRPTLVYGPAQGFNLFSFLANAIASGSDEIALDGGAQTRDPVYVDDAVSAFIAAGEHCSSLNGRNLPLSGGREISVLELAELTVRLLGGQQRVVCRPTKVRPTETMRSWCDNTEISSELGWTPSTSLEEGILRTADFLGLRAISPSFTEQA